MKQRKGNTEHGSLVVMVALGMVVFFGFTALAIDLGLFYEDRRHLQNSSDAAALAGVAELPANPDLAVKRAEDWAANNGIRPEQIEKIEVRSTDVANDTLYIQLADEFSWIFGRSLGLVTSRVDANAAARVGSLAGGNDLMPWAILQGDSDCLDANGDAVLNADCTVKVGAGGSAINGWYGALDFDGNGGGAAEYQGNIIDGTADTTYCIDGQSLPACQATIVDALSGNKVGGTGHGIDDRLAAGPACDANKNGKDDFGEVFVSNGPNSYSVACPGSPWLVMIPIVSYDSTPIQTVTIEGWSLAYYDSYSCVDGNCKGTGHWEVQVSIVNAVYSQADWFLMAYDPADGVTARRLVQ